MCKEEIVLKQELKLSQTDLSLTEILLTFTVRQFGKKHIVLNLEHQKHILRVYTIIVCVEKPTESMYCHFTQTSSQTT